MSRTGDRLARLEEIAERTEAAVARVEAALSALGTRQADAASGLDDTVANLAEAIQRMVAARGEHDAIVAAEAKAARSAAESAFVGVQALAAVAPKPEAAIPPAPADGPGTSGRKPKASGM